MLFEVRNINKSFKNIPVIEDFSLEVEEGDMIALVGKRKHGKTTLMQMLAGLLPVDSGEIYYRGKLVGSKGRTSGLCRLRRSKIGYINTEAILIPDMTVYENMFLGMSHFKGSSKQKKLLVKEVLKNLGLKGKGRYYPKELSTLERQKVCVARAIINEPELLICDEPTDILEGYGAEQLMDILEILNSAGYTIILSTHSKRVAARCRKVFPVHEGLDLSGLGTITERSDDAGEKTVMDEKENQQASEPSMDTEDPQMSESSMEIGASQVSEDSMETETLQRSEPSVEKVNPQISELSVDVDGEKVTVKTEDGEHQEEVDEDKDDDLPEIDLTGIFG